MQVAVIDQNRRPLAPTSEVRARLLLKEGKAAVFRRVPFTILLKRVVEDVQVPDLRLKLDPGSRKTGVAIVNQESGQVIFAAEIEHRGEAIKQALDTRRAIRRSRRSRKTRYRKARFLNRRRPEGWLPPSLKSRISNDRGKKRAGARFSHHQRLHRRHAPSSVATIARLPCDSFQPRAGYRRFVYYTPIRKKDGPSLSTFIPQCLDRIGACCVVCRPETEEETDADRDYQAGSDGANRNAFTSFCGFRFMIIRQETRPRSKRRPAIDPSVMCYETGP
jgi:hypothetical protein